MNAKSFRGLEIFDLEQLACCYNCVKKDPEDLSRLLEYVDWSIVDVTADGGSFLGYLHIDPRKNRYFVSPARPFSEITDIDLSVYLNSIGMSRICEGTLIKNSIISKKRRELIAHTKVYEASDSVCSKTASVQEIIAGKPVQIMANMGGREVLMVGYANHPGWDTTNDEFSFGFSSFHPNLKNGPKGFNSMRISRMTYDPNLAKNKTANLYVPII